MGINIDHEDIEWTIRRLANERGLSEIEAIDLAVRNELARSEKEMRAADFLERVRAVQAIVRTSPVLDPRSPDEIIGYNEHGVPA